MVWKAFSYIWQTFYCLSEKPVYVKVMDNAFIIEQVYKLNDRPRASKPLY